jgi:mRNA-degrading endonuclease RelE of RelBE toxin-antitoxin system
VASKWRVKLTDSAINGLDRILKDHGDGAYQDCLNAILALEEDPTPHDAVHLKKTRGEYRIPINRNRYRAIYRVLPDQGLLVVTRVAVRDRRTYRGYYESIKACLSWMPAWDQGGQS